jgi:peptidoglycan/LPS O-acetylase OafA/YrhL
MSVSVTATKNLSPVRTAEDRARTAASEIAVVKPDRAKRILELDGVRGLAIALVLVFHYSDGAIVTGSKTVFGSSALFYAFLPTRLMWSGVDLFFVLSGFLIGGILLDSRDSPRYFGTFYARRIHRIFPIYYLMIAFVTVGVLNWPQSPLFRGDMPLWTYPLYAQNLTGDYTQMANAIEVSWSLAVEEQFYLLFPFLVRFCSRRTIMYALGVCIVGAPLLRSLMVYGGLGYEEIYPLLPTRADTLALGVVAAMIVRSEVATRLIRRHSRALYGCLVALVLAFATMLKWTSVRQATAFLASLSFSSSCFSSSHRYHESERRSVRRGCGGSGLFRIACIWCTSRSRSACFCCFSQEPSPQSPDCRQCSSPWPRSWRQWPSRTSHGV